MAAPMKIPSHHIKGEVAPNRPAYREGRQPKATKVYTVNQESVYLLVQGVPALGTSQELIQQFAVYGAIQEYRILDEYPTADRYHDVYLIKFQKIQAARFAKKKLDDYSFYGGLLHISYAPEFESVEETREKLQEQRRNIASRLRLLGKETQKKITEEPRMEGIQHSDEKGMEENSHKPPPVNPSHVILPDPSTRLHNPKPEPDPSMGSYNQISYREPISDLIPQPEPCYHIPPPPKQDYRINPKKENRNNYEFARVPSAHATLPKEMMEHKRVNFQQQMIKTDSHESRTENQPSDITCNSCDDRDKPNDSEVKTVNGLIVRDVPKQRSAPKFIPRQTLKITKSQPKLGAEGTSESDKIREELQQNAFLLGKKQGPRAKVEETKPASTEEERSVSKTVTQIRKRLHEIFETGALERKEKQRKVVDKT